MDDVKRFIRFTLPGIVALAQFLFAVYLTAPEQITSVQEQLDDLASVAVLAIGVLVTSGAVGYVLASAYHALNWALDGLAIDHLTTVKALMSQGELKVTDRTEKPVSHEELDKRDAWMIWTYYFYANVRGSDQLTGLKEISDRLVDYAHSHGTILLGTVLGSLFWLFFFSRWAQMDFRHVSLIDGLVLVYWGCLGGLYFYLQRLAINANESISTAGVLAHMKGSKKQSKKKSKKESDESAVVISGIHKGK